MGFGQRNELQAYNAKLWHERHIREQKMLAEHSAFADCLIVAVALLVGLVAFIAGWV